MATAVKVQRLTLRATRRDAIGRTVVAVEGAFRTASLAGTAAGEVTLVRRLDLGVIRLGAPSQTLALRIEAALRSITPLRLRAGDAAPPDAAAVSFADQAEALAALLVAAQRGAQRGWWWARLLPEAARAGALPALVPAALAAAEREGGFALIAAMVGRLVAINEADAVLAAVPGETIARALARAGVGSTPRRDAVAMSSVPHEKALERIPPVTITPRTQAIVSALAPLWLNAIRRWTTSRSTPEPHAFFLTAVALSETFGPAAIAEAHSVLQVLATTPTEHSARAIAHARADVHPTAMSPPALERIPAKMPLRTQPSDLTDLAPSPSPEESLRTPASLWRSTRHAGLLFLIPAFTRLSLGTLDPAQGDLPLRLMRFLATRLRIRPDDAALSWLPEPLPDPAPARFIAPPDWAKLLDLDTLYIRRVGEPGRRALTDRLGRVLAGLVGPGDLGNIHWPLRHARALPAMQAEARLMAGLTLAVSRLLRRHARISLRRLTQRPGLVRASATHLEVIIHARFVDVNLRRAALDLDPGWVPWLGKAVRFEFDYGEDDRAGSP